MATGGLIPNKVGMSSSCDHPGSFASGMGVRRTGAGPFASGTGAVSMNGDTALNGYNIITDGKGLHMTGAGTVSSGTGADTLNGDVAIASGMDLHMTGAGTFTSGTGAVTLTGDTALNCDNTIADGRDLHVTGAGTFASGTGAVTLKGAATIATNLAFTVGAEWDTGTSSFHLLSPTPVQGLSPRAPVYSRPTAMSPLPTTRTCP